eukprot:gene7738-5427_t
MKFLSSLFSCCDDQAAKRSRAEQRATENLFHIAQDFTNRKDLKKVERYVKQGADVTYRPHKDVLPSFLLFTISSRVEMFAACMQTKRAINFDFPYLKWPRRPVAGRGTCSTTSSSCSQSASHATTAPPPALTGLESSVRTSSEMCGGTAYGGSISRTFVFSPVRECTAAGLRSNSPVGPGAVVSFALTEDDQEELLTTTVLSSDGEELEPLDGEGGLYLSPGVLVYICSGHTADEVKVMLRAILRRHTDGPHAPYVEEEEEEVEGDALVGELQRRTTDNREDFDDDSSRRQPLEDRERGGRNADETVGAAPNGVKAERSCPEGRLADGRKVTAANRNDTSLSSCSLSSTTLRSKPARNSKTKQKRGKNFPTKKKSPARRAEKTRRKQRYRFSHLQDHIDWDNPLHTSPPCSFLSLAAESGVLHAVWPLLRDALPCYRALRPGFAPKRLHTASPPGRRSAAGDTQKMWEGGTKADPREHHYPQRVPPPPPPFKPLGDPSLPLGSNAPFNPLIRSPKSQNSSCSSSLSIGKRGGGGLHTHVFHPPPASASSAPLPYNVADALRASDTQDSSSIPLFLQSEDNSNDSSDSNDIACKTLHSVEEYGGSRGQGGAPRTPTGAAASAVQRTQMKDMMMMLTDEMEIMKHLRHKNIVTFYGATTSTVTRDGEETTCVSPSPLSICLVFLCSLCDLIVTTKKIRTGVNVLYICVVRYIRVRYELTDSDEGAAEGGLFVRVLQPQEIEEWSWIGMSASDNEINRHGGVKEKVREFWLQGKRRHRLRLSLPLSLSRVWDAIAAPPPFRSFIQTRPASFLPMNMNSFWLVFPYEVFLCVTVLDNIMVLKAEISARNLLESFSPYDTTMGSNF